MVMFRVALCSALVVALTGCALSTSSLTSGAASPPQAQAKSSFDSAERGTSRGALGGEPTTRVAAADAQRAVKPDDKVPKGSFEKAPPGALADRDFSGTRLDPEKARDIINAYRREKGLKPVKLNTSLTEAAKAHARDLAKWDRISHYGSDGSNPWDRVKRTGYNAKLAAENVGTGQATIDEVFKGWQNSPGHNKNLLLADADHMGIALVQDPKTEFKTFWTLVLGSSL
jgi:uncharacterized protein YkwD